VVDADGLNVISRERLTLPPQTVITPHPGEAARLLGLSVAEGESDRFATVQRLSTEYRCVAVLKGAPSVIDDGTAGWVSQIVNPYLATGGSGDVLAGIIGALMAQGASPTAAAALGVIVHGEAGHRVMKRRYGPLIASDLIDELPGVIGDCTIAVDSAL
jgi:NAD(P)H-hydrate epimerase